MSGERIGKYLSVIPDFLPSKRKTRSMIVMNDDFYEVGKLRWYGAWRQYCFFPNPREQMVLHNGCLRDIAAYLDRMNSAQRTERARRSKPCKRSKAS